MTYMVSNLFNHEEHKVLRQAQDNSTKVHKVNILNVLINLYELELSEATFLYFLICLIWLINLQSTKVDIRPKAKTKPNGAKLISNFNIQNSILNIQH